MHRIQWRVVNLAAALCVLLTAASAAQALTGALIGTVRDDQGGVVAGAVVRVSSTSLLGGSLTATTNEKGQLRFLALPPGTYALAIEQPGFETLHDNEIHIGAGATIERTAVLQLDGVAESVVVEGAGSRIEVRDPGLGTRFRSDDLRTIPTRRASMFDFIKAAPGVSPTSPSSGTTATVSAFGSGTNENQFLFDGTNFTCPCNGVARSEPGVDFIQEIQVQSVGASAEFGNVQGAVINIITRQGGDRLAFDASFYLQPAALTSQPILRSGFSRTDTRASGYERVKYRDATSNLGGPLRRDRVWFFGGYQYFRDYDVQPGTNPSFPRTYEQDKIFGKLTWRLAPGLQLQQSLHHEVWVSPDRPTVTQPFEATSRTNATVPAMTFGHLTHTLSASTLWDVRVGRFAFTQDSPPSTGDRTTPSRLDRQTNVISGAPQQMSTLVVARTTMKGTVTHYQPKLFGLEHQWKFGGQVERGAHHAINVIPTGVRYVDDVTDSRFPQAISRTPAHDGGLFNTAAAFMSDAITVGNRLTMNLGLRFDHTRAISQDLHALDGDGHETNAIVPGLGRLYTWNIISPRLGLTTKLSADGRTMLRANYGRFSQGVLTGELGPFHPAVTAITTRGLNPLTGDYTREISTVDPKSNLRLDPNIRAPRTDELALSVDRQVGRRLAVAIAYVHKTGANFIGWTDVGGVYRPELAELRDGRVISILALSNGTAARRFLLTNPKEYSLTYNGLVIVAERRRANGWQAFGSYTLSRASGLQVSSGASAGGPQVSTVSPPQPITFGRDPNDLTNARGRLPNDRPHMVRVMGSVDLPRTGVLLAANLQHFTGKPWAATTSIVLPQGDQRILLEPRGTRRLSSQSLLDLRVSKAVSLAGVGRVELMLDILNALNDTAEENVASDNFFIATFGQSTVFIDPRRAMISARVNLGK